LYLHWNCYNCIHSKNDTNKMSKVKVSAFIFPLRSCNIRLHVHSYMYHFDCTTFLIQKKKTDADTFLWTLMSISTWYAQLIPWNTRVYKDTWAYPLCPIVVSLLFTINSYFEYLSWKLCILFTFYRLTSSNFVHVASSKSIWFIDWSI